MTRIDKEINDIFNTLLSPAIYAKNMMHTTYPPYNIIRSSANETVIEIAVAGFKREELTITAQDSVLKIVGKKTITDVADYIYKGIGGRAFERTFNLSPDMEIVSADYVDGILSIVIKKHTKEQNKINVIPIGNNQRKYLSERDDIL